jgi:hypothetical protein
MRKCLYNAGLTDSKESNKVEFTTERKSKIKFYCSFKSINTNIICHLAEAAAIYCMRNLDEQNKIIPING